ncbi:helix-hairpin-helix domain-containing protein [Flavobacterium sp.]|uniref:ComEA family DNA-binding protein n=1 Tax=Flavobacterium sp. TaxID=239 RepID=UPI00262459CA|nr:helix-hairpin-helix domain-containing protein [Flavobacterium sp.]MDG2431673.1 helix-hairpin-helix domain-containing protein [Flavobacterium sp.]
MKFKTIVDYGKYSKEQALGVISLFLVVLILQLCYYYLDFNKYVAESPEKQSWIANQVVVDSLKKGITNTKPTIFPFNPNFISDYKGYKLGMSVAEINRLLAFRKSNQYVNSVSEFQKVTLVSDSLLETMSPFFKFPDWVKNKKVTSSFQYESPKQFIKSEKVVMKNINEASHEDLVKVYGVGQVLSERILKFKETVGAIVSMDQMSDVWGLSPEVIEKLKLSFKVGAIPEMRKLDINNASIKELGQFVYFKNGLAREIVIYRSMNGDFKNIEDLIKIKGFPVEKRNIIALYLDFR